MTRWQMIVVLGLCLLIPLGVWYGIVQARQLPSRVISAIDADRQARAGEIVLVDIRTPDEWRQTGIPASAHAITMHQDPKVFMQQLLAAMGDDRDRQVALICRTGNRSGHLQSELRRAGISNVLDVGEGVAGSRHGKGWLGSRLELRPATGTSRPSVVMKAAPK